MSRIDRRKFLALTGATTAGLAAGELTEASSQIRIRRKKVPAPQPPPQLEPPVEVIPAPAPPPQEPEVVAEKADFEIHVNSSGRAEVLTKLGLSLGTFPLVSLENGSGLLKDRAIELEKRLDEGGLAERKSASVTELLIDLPDPLVPLALQPLTTSTSVEKPFSITINIVTQADQEEVFPSSLGHFNGEDIVKPEWGYGNRFGNYYVRGSIETGLIRGCINRRVQHAGFMVHQLDPKTGKMQQMLFDIHVASWWDRGRACFAVYESKSGFCRNTCDYPAWDKIARYVNETVGRVLPSWLAWTVAAAVGVAAVGALTIIPGVPPPP